MKFSPKRFPKKIKIQDRTVIESFFFGKDRFHSFGIFFKRTIIKIAEKKQTALACLYIIQVKLAFEFAWLSSQGRLDLGDHTSDSKHHPGNNHAINGIVRRRGRFK